MEEGGRRKKGGLVVLWNAPRQAQESWFMAPEPDALQIHQRPGFLKAVALTYDLRLILCLGKSVNEPSIIWGSRPSSLTLRTIAPDARISMILFPVE